MVDKIDEMSTEITQFRQTLEHVLEEQNNFWNKFDSGQLEGSKISEF
jgi:hypothetical protein